MTQEPHDAEAPKPSEASPSAWAPRSDEPAASEPEPSVPPSSVTGETEPSVSAAGETGVTETTPVTAEEASAAATSVPVAGEDDTVVAPAPAPVAVPPARRGVPAWLLLVAAIVPAAIVGLAVFLLASGSDTEPDSREAAAVVDGLMRLGRASQEGVNSYVGQLPPEFTTEFPMYEGADLVVSIAFASPEGTGYLIVLSTEDSEADVYSFFSQALDTDPWQVEVGRSSEAFTGLRFLRPDNIDVSGDVSLHASTLDDRTLIYLSYTDISQALLPGRSPSSFAPGATRSLPAGFPEEIPIYAGTADTVILDTYFERAQGGQAFVVTFLTPDTSDDVINFYRSEFEGRGWNVSEAGTATTSFAIGIQFDDGENSQFAGSITADAFVEDPSYTQVDLVVTRQN